ncbi:DUF4105 domain-containing protein [Arenimonas oryziterrae]|uniref:Lnb N-terminal periplasmic domain-containing protein n=1 Tax=Arenimonas oryziterrae DSM 21050 = YC6267 TaxID=1121015 RepID=A0A091BKZ5_9GAMM|nr:DUF4105 domain-containing protein [Arenimonas oryziterrae]KFN44990.1 hypothetical protein N789_02935 [Arenimonas oryziterrae DSM 21050 = YC6267]
MRPTSVVGALLIALMLCLPGTGRAQTGAPADARVAVAAPSAPRIGVITMEPGEAFWERFGHDAIVVVDAVTGEAISYNFGFFDMSEPGFVDNFIHGRMRYQLVALPLEDDLANYEGKGRGVTMQWLDLTPAQANALAAALVENARPENSRYTYEYFTANCATRVRDNLDAVLGGALKQQLTTRSQGNSYRSESVRLAWPAKWMAFGFHLGLSGAADRSLSRWEESFIPMRLRDALRVVKLADGRPLVREELTLLPHRLSSPPTETPRWRVPALFVGIAFAAGILLLGRRHPRLLAGLALPFWIVAAALGALMLFIWFGSAHVFGYANENLLLLSPLCLGLLPGAWGVLRGRPASVLFQRMLWLVAGSAAIAGFLKFLPFRPQENVEWVLLLLPMHWALARTFSPKKS